MLTACVATGVQLRTDLDSGVFDRFKVLPIARIAPLAGPMVADMLRYFIAAVLTFCVGILIGYRPGGGFVGVAGAILLAVVAGWSLAWIFTFFGLVGRNAQGVQGISLLVMFPLTFLSNAFVPTETMPRPLEAFAERQPRLAGDHRAARPRQQRPGHRRRRLGAAGLRRGGGDLRAAVGAPLQEDVSHAVRAQPVHDRRGVGQQRRSGAVGQLLDEAADPPRHARRRPARAIGSHAITGMLRL